MGKRSTGRKLALQALYQCEIRQNEVDAIIDDFITPAEQTAETKKWAEHLTRKTWENRLECDGIVKKFSIGWDLDRLNIIDKSLLRMGLYEIIYIQTPASVVINEIIELSKKFSTDESPKFINGILGNFIKTECSPE